MKTLSLKNLFAYLFILFIGLLAATALQAWTGPTATAPAGNVSAPINVGTTNQVKNAGLSVNALTVFGSQYIQTALGIGRQSPVVALDVNGTMRLANGGEVCQAVTEGSIRYNSTSQTMEYCNGTAWGALGAGGGTNLSRIVSLTSGSGTYTTPSNISYLVVELVGGGGSGAAGYDGGSYGVGGAGGNTTFGTLVASGGNYGSSAGGVGGGATGGDINIAGGGGTMGASPIYGQAIGVGGAGGSSYFGGAGGGAYGDGVAAVPNSGGGGGGGRAGAPNWTGAGGGGGGAGGYVKKVYIAPAASYTYSVGSGGSPGSNGSGSGGAGGAGRINVYEYTGSSGSGGSVGALSVTAVSHTAHVTCDGSQTSSVSCPAGTTVSGCSGWTGATWNSSGAWKDGNGCTADCGGGTANDLAVQAMCMSIQ